MTRTAFGAALALFVCLLGVDASPSPSPSPAPAVVIHIKDYAFSPNTVTINAGQSVEWINDDTVAHSATADDKSFDSGELSQHDTWTHTFTKAGTYDYVCDDHEFMRATVIVR
jgi:plastocyanin